MARRLLLAVARALAFGVGIALVICSLMTLGQEERSLRYFGVAMAISMSHAVFIGVPAALALALMHDRLLRATPLRQWAIVVATLLAFTVVGSFAAALVLIGSGLFDAHEYMSRLLVGIAGTSAISLLLGAGALSYERLRARLQRANSDLYEKELERLRALSLAADARLASLESRIRPHFLFNALNAALALIPEDPTAAERLLERMAELLRASLDADLAGLVPLQREMAMVVDYLEIERARFGARLRLELDVSGDVAPALVPPFSVQTLVENSVKYAVAAKKAGGTVRVAARRDGQRLLVEVSDDGPGFEAAAIAPGHGLDTLRGRFAALFGDRGALQIAAAPAGGSVVTLTVPFEIDLV
jgi:sensor histidine kinase YesM